ncbi:MAG: hypothetical protein PVJ60_02695 [Phycisphaerales bacterium]|jgi:hypothetical protein
MIDIDKDALNYDLRKFIEICELEFCDTKLTEFLNKIPFKHVTYIISCIANGKYNYKPDSINRFLKVEIKPGKYPTQFFIDKIINEKKRLKFFKNSFGG